MTTWFGADERAASAGGSARPPAPVGVAEACDSRRAVRGIGDTYRTGSRGSERQAV